VIDRGAALGAELAAVVPADPDERAALRRIAALLAGDGDPVDRDAITPGHVTASAFVLHPDGDRLLLVWHRKLQRWLQPGGHVDPGDPSTWAAARREVGEETGLAVEMVGSWPFDVDVHRVDHDGVAHEHFDVRYLVTAQGEPKAGDGVDAVRWATLAEFEGMDESLRRPARKALGEGPDASLL
jgi:8-oxo-dGTP pyrophosphatase MutT (NUDIX family)